MVKKTDISILKSKYGNWTVIGEGPRIGVENKRSAKCVCVCNKTKNVLITALVNGRSSGCGCNKKPSHMLKSNEIDDVYGYWQVINEAPRRGIAKQRAFNCECVCGNVGVVLLNDLRQAKSTSCGCISRTTYNQYKTRLYGCWHGMKGRVLERTNQGLVCGLYPDWHEFEPFRDWALDNGYDDSLILCRNGDVGDYEPDNCRWDTHQSNLEEAHAKHFVMVSPSGDVVDIYNLNKFSRDNNLNGSCMHAVYGGHKKTHKGWTKYNEE